MTDLRSDKLKAVQPDPGGAFVIPDGGSINDILAVLEETDTWTLEIDDGQRQCVLLGLQKLRVERPGWDYMLGVIEAKLGGQMEWPPALLATCFRCGKEKPGAQLVTTERGGKYCLDCLKLGVEICRGCGCTDEVACPGRCYWVRQGICSNCEGVV